MYTLIKQFPVKSSWSLLVVFSLFTSVSCKKDDYYSFFKKNVSEINYAINLYKVGLKVLPINGKNETGLDTKTLLLEKLSGKNRKGKDYLLNKQFFNDIEVFSTGNWLMITYPGRDGEYNTKDDLIGVINLKNHQKPTFFKVVDYGE